MSGQRRAMSSLQRLGSRTEDGLLLLAMFLMLGLVVLQVTSRLIGRPPTWTEEVSRYVMVWLAFLGAAVDVRYQEHVGFSYLETRLGRRAKVGLGIFIDLCCLAFVAVLLFEGAKWVGTLATAGQRTTQLDFPVYLIAVAIPLCGFLSSVHLVRRIWVSTGVLLRGVIAKLSQSPSD